MGNFCGVYDYSVKWASCGILDTGIPKVKIWICRLICHNIMYIRSVNKTVIISFLVSLYEKIIAEEDEEENLFKSIMRLALKWLMLISHPESRLCGLGSSSSQIPIKFETDFSTLTLFDLNELLITVSYCRNDNLMRGKIVLKS